MFNALVIFPFWYFFGDFINISIFMANFTKSTIQDFLFPQFGNAKDQYYGTCFVCVAY